MASSASALVMALVVGLARGAGAGGWRGGLAQVGMSTTSRVYTYIVCLCPTSFDRTLTGVSNAKIATEYPMSVGVVRCASSAVDFPQDPTCRLVSY
jgi:hypothetical protein